MALPDFSTMTKEQIAEWAMHNDTSELIRLARPGPEMGPAPATLPLENVSVTFRAPTELVTKLDAFVGRDKEGRSGVLRAALAEYLERHRSEAA